MGLSTNLSYKNLDFAVVSRASIGNYAYNNRASLSTVNSINLFPGYLTNIHADYLRTQFQNTTDSNLLSDYFIENASFIKIDNVARHPSQLYEALLEGFTLFLILLYFRKKNYLKKPGSISALFLIFYSIFRFATEFFRVPDEQLGYLIFNLTMGQIISFIFLTIGIYLIIKKYEVKKIS